jgi:hypothetical protein
LGVFHDPAVDPSPKCAEAAEKILSQLYTGVSITGEQRTSIAIDGSITGTWKTRKMKLSIDVKYKPGKRVVEFQIGGERDFSALHVILFFIGGALVTVNPVISGAMMWPFVFGIIPYLLNASYDYQILKDAVAATPVE